MAQPTTGRPRGSRNQPANQTDGQLTRCAKCGSTEREPYQWKQEQEFAGTDGGGQPYTHIVRRRTRCAACGQMRIDRTFENRPRKKNR